MDQELSGDDLQVLYAWIDQIPLSRPKKHITRDFSDGVMAAEVVKHFFPKLVELHNYSPANSTPQKISNWTILNRKVFSKLDFEVSEERIQKISLKKAGVVERMLFALREKIGLKLEQSTQNTSEPEYYNINHMKNQESLPAESRGLEERVQAHRRNQKGPAQGSKHQELGVHETDAALRSVLLDQENAVRALQETVEILQMKVSRLEHLVHLKDLRIEDLSRHLDSHRTRPSRP